ncbi:MAG: methylated-DNA--[protein]-cysteine S-methyltransferase [Pseudomonadota bacterium]
MSAAGFALFDTTIGHCGIAWNEGDTSLAGVLLPEGSEQATRARMQAKFPGVTEMHAPSGVQKIMQRVVALLEGARDDLVDITLDMTGVPPFHQRVYAEARAIPPGRTLTYGEVASRLGEPGASRAVGQALGHNPFAPIVPCHRVLAAENASGGFSAGGGVSTKLRMLEIEKARFGPQAGLFDG